MEMRPLGSSGLFVSAFSFGTMTFGTRKGDAGPLGTVHGDQCRRQIDICLDAGVNFFDTANYYSRGNSEIALGKALGARRKDVLIATKAALPMGKGPHDLGAGRRHLIESCEASLKRLGTDWIDLFQLHQFDALTPLEETLRALDDLVRDGKVRYVGCSNYSAWHLMKALAIADRLNCGRYISQQIEYSLKVRDAEHELLPCGIDQQVGAIVWSPLAAGYLSGKFRDSKSAKDTRLGRTNRLRESDVGQGQAILAVIDKIVSVRSGVSASQVALNWLLERPGVATVLIGARTDDQLIDNLAARTWSLTAEEIEDLDRASQGPEPYPVSIQHRYAGARNPRLFARYEASST